MRFQALVEVRTRPGMADPEGATIEAALPALGFADVKDVRVGKAIRLEVEASDEGAARARLDQLSETFLSNPVIEDYEVSISPAGRVPA
ncbi:MAG TPA: phosphoribosylformylglycinamidine synthase subunit PurS [Acidimicrobiales bacterium]|nr:phosphoribosylformylglycinamidine synthase subunit PurS [Acidimicrobiales bacterium]